MSRTRGAVPSASVQWRHSRYLSNDAALLWFVAPSTVNYV